MNALGIREDLLPQTAVVQWVRGLITGGGQDSVRIHIEDIADQIGDVMTVVMPDGTSGLLGDILQQINNNATGGLKGGVATYANLIALTGIAEGELWQVGNDPDPTKNGVYRKDATGPDGWVKTADKYDALKVQVDGIQAIVDPMAAAMAILPGFIVQIINGLDFAGMQWRIIAAPDYNWAIVDDGDRVFIGDRTDGQFEFFGIRFQYLSEAEYPFMVVTYDDDPIYLQGEDGYPVGGLTPTEIAEVEALIGGGGGLNEPEESLNPVFISGGDLFETGPLGDRLLYSMPGTATFEDRQPRYRGNAIIATSNFAYSTPNPTPIAYIKKIGVAFPCSPEVVHLVMIIGQSNAAGAEALIISDGLTTNPYPDRVLKGSGPPHPDVRLGMPCDGTPTPTLDPATITGLDALVSMLNTTGTCGVTICEGMGPEVVRLLHTEGQFQPRTLYADFSRGGTNYAGLKKGTVTYNNSITGMTKLCQLVRDAGFIPVISAIIVLHGEADGASPTYGANCIEWRSDYNTDLRPLGGQIGVGQPWEIPFIFVQPGGFSEGNHLSALAMVKLMRDHPTQFTVACPSYWLAYSPMGDLYALDRIHYTAKAQMLLGADFVADAFLHHCFGTGHMPLHFDLSDVTWNGTTLTVGANVPVPPIALDAVTIPNPGSYGFKAYDSLGALSVSSVTVADPTHLAFTFGRATGSARFLEYATTGYPAGTKVIANQPRGCVRDSGPLIRVPGVAARQWMLVDQVPF